MLALSLIHIYYRTLSHILVVAVIPSLCLLNQLSRIFIAISLVFHARCILVNVSTWPVSMFSFVLHQKELDLLLDLETLQK